MLVRLLFGFHDLFIFLCYSAFVGKALTTGLTKKTEERGVVILTPDHGNVNRELKAELTRKGIRHKEIAELIGKVETYVSLRMNCKAYWNTREIQLIAQRAGIPENQWIRVFFVQDEKR